MHSRVSISPILAIALCLVSNLAGKAESERARLIHATGGQEAQPLLPTTNLQYCGTGILPVAENGGGPDAQPLLPTTNF
ncbi:MAG: hypothetical protein WCD53_25905, partial [Microcoleus sp.]